VIATARAERLSRPNGWWGMLVFVVSEATLFGCLLGSYFFLRFQSVDWPQGGIEPKDPVVPMILLGALVTTSVPLQLAWLAARGGRTGLARLLVMVALVVQAGYLAYGIYDLRADLELFVPQDNAYASIYYTLLGADHAHLALGLLLSAWIVLRPSGLRAVVLYWHSVNAITLAVVATILYPSA
jgi:heme/copper-type cytochrome/quinol oxidase subunit 3